jgi:hypothetical protein
MSQDLAAGEQSAAVAIVAWDGPRRTEARIEVGLHAGEAARWLSRELFFSAGDPEVERWRTVGFAVATLVGDLFGQSGDETKKVPPPPANTPAQQRSLARSSAASAPDQAPPARAGESPASWWLDGQFLMLTGLTGAQTAAFPPAGGQLSVSRTFGQGSFFVDSSARVTFQSLGAGSLRLSLVRPGVSAGAGIVALRLGDRVHFAVRLEPLVELVEVNAKDSASGESDRGAHLLLGLRQAVDASWMWSRSLGLAVGAELDEATGATDIRVRSELVARIPAVNFAFEGGIRLALP